MTRIAVLDYGIGNLRSAEKALQHLGADARLVTDGRDAEAADGVVLPGVGAFGRCMEALVGSGLDDVARQAIAAGTPFLGICVGMQMLYATSEESPGVEGLAIFDGVVRALPDGVKRPQMQWNRLHLRLKSPMFAGLEESPWFYFVHSYAPEATSDTVATCDYGGPITAAIDAGFLWATQFHPEKSGVNGLRLLESFIGLCERGG